MRQRRYSRQIGIILKLPDSGSNSKKNIAFHSSRIIVVDDDEINLYATKSLLEIEGVKVTLAENGEQALKFLSRKNLI